MASLKVVALISGGKDSLFSILHCIANGHEVVALANLYPPPSSNGRVVDDVDSYMYQTIGHTVIPLYEKALGIPLYRQEILGHAVNKAKSYELRHDGLEGPSDETESLIPLLQKVKKAHPEVNAVSTGAILSDYQRTRVESVAIRLGLTPLSYLWQWPSLPPHSQSSLLEDMAAVGQDARIIKVASGGLDETFLWQNVANRDIIARLTKASQRFGTYGDGAVLGEGGEYETLAVSGPKPLWKAAIKVDKNDVHVVSGEAGTAYVQVQNTGLEECQADQSTTRGLRIPNTWDAAFDTMFAKLLAPSQVTQDASGIVSASLPVCSTPALPASGMRLTFEETENTVLISGVTGEGMDAADHMRSIMLQIRSALEHLGHGTNVIAYCSIILRQMADFASINAVYGSFFTEPNPPARVTVACADALRPGQLVGLAVTSTKTDPGEREGLHVQSRSYWAPANIGPYSQAIAVPASGTPKTSRGKIIYIAGQIPLVPASMELGSPPARPGHSREQSAHQALLALQHLVRIGNVTGVRHWVACIAFIEARTSEDARPLGTIARDAWHALHQAPENENDDMHRDADVDIWDIRNNTYLSPGPVTADQRQTSASVMVRDGHTPPLWIFYVDALPRGSSIEWVAYGSSSELREEISLPHLQHLLTTFQHRIV